MNEDIVRVTVEKDGNVADRFVTYDILHDGPALAFVVRDLAEQVTHEVFIPRIKAEERG